ncbi:MAG: MerR family transcriptional regulator [Deferribacterales bacterium]|nr:MerR family transcriptional regulator [Deferribacterales bacterium]
MAKQYYKIGEVSKLLNITSSTLRFWESEFRQLNPFKSSTNQRYYTPEDIEFLKRLKVMLYEEKYTIEGAKKRLHPSNNISVPQPVSTLKNTDIDAIKQELIDALQFLK